MTRSSLKVLETLKKKGFRHYCQDFFLKSYWHIKQTLRKEGVIEYIVLACITAQKVRFSIKYFFTQVAWWIYRYQNEQKGKLHHFFYFWTLHHRKGLPKLSRNECRNYQALYFLCLTFWFLLSTKRSHILK